MQTYSPKEARDMILAGTAPANMVVDGDLNLHNRKELNELPNGLRVESNLYLEGCTALTELPDDLIVEGNLYVMNCTALTELPDGLKVGGWLSLGDCTSLTRLPKGLRVESNLYLEGCTALTELPDGLSVGGNLYLWNCTALTNLSDGFIVGLSLYLWGCNELTALPEGLKVGGWIYLNHPLSIPDTVKCESFVFRGVKNFPREFINNPQLIKSADILNEQNAQKRSALLELTGIPRFMREVTPAIVHQDVEHNGNVRQLLRVELPSVIDGWTNRLIQEEPIVMLSVTCPSTAHHYMLRVPPDMQTCHQAAAWIAGFDDPELYQPVLET
jgi:hypothetical protein